MLTTPHRVGTDQATDPEPQDEYSRDPRQNQPGKEKAEAEIDPYPSGSDSRPTETTGIQRRTLECQALFESCQKSPHLSGDDWIDKMSAEFNWWSLGIGAAKEGHSSLDYRVQKRDDVRSTLVNLLESLATSLDKYIDAASQRCDHSQSTIVPTQEQDPAEAAVDGSDLQSSDDYSPFDEQRYYIETTIRYLAQISTAIHKSGTKFRHQRADRLLAAREPELKQFGDYMRHSFLMSPTKVHTLHGVMHQYSLTGDPLWKNVWITLKAYFTDTQRLTPVQNRLIQANLVRRNRFDLYLAQYHRKMQVQKRPQMPFTQAQTMTTGPPTEPPFPAPSQSHVSQTTSKQGENTHIGPLVMEGSQQSSHSATNIGSLVMPSHPQEQKARSVGTNLSQRALEQDYPKCPGTEGESFWCPYCAQLLDSSYSDPSNERWRCHVVEDLSPYVCVYGDCDSPLSMYVTTAEWKKHIRDKHSRARWICDPCWLSSDHPEEFEFDTEEEWHTHTLAEHEDEIDEGDLPDLAELSQRTRVPPVACPLCHEDASLRNPETDDHMAEHLHHFALQALPWESVCCDQETQVSIGSNIMKSHDLVNGEQSATEEPRDDGDEVIAFQTLVSTIRNITGLILRTGHYHPATSISALLLTIDTHLDRPSVRFQGYRLPFRTEILDCLTRLGSIMQRHEGQSSDPKEREFIHMWEEDLAQVFKHFQHLESLSDLESPEPSGLSEMQLLGDTRVLEASDKPRSDEARDPENRELGGKGGVGVDVLTLADQDQSRNNMTACGEKLEHLKMQFHGQDGTGKERPHYIPRYSLEEFWETQSINAILRAHSVNKSQGVIRHSFLCTFSLLVYINEVRFFEWLIERNLKDASFPLEARPSFWPDTPATNRLFEAITESQWIFFPVTFDQHKLYNQVFGPRYIFPICKQDFIKAGDTVQFHKIETNPSYKGSDTATLVRKTYNESGKAQYEREVKTFSSLQSRSSPHIISYHGCYQQQRLDSTTTYNLILGFVEGGNLEEFYTDMSPPRSLPDTNKIWNAFCGVLEGLHHLHSAGINTNFQTIHQDIKPDNLLVSKSASGQPYDIELVITDFGYSHTKTAKSSPETRSISSHEGQVYGAPESSHLYPRGGQTDITPKIDIWSLGCVMSEIGVWIKSGRQGLEDYRNRRLAEARKLPIRHGVDYVACFHDSAEPLSTVRMTHDWIRGSFPDDTITLQVLDMIETCMLVPQGDRKEAQILCERLAKIIQASSMGLKYNSLPPRLSTTSSPTILPPEAISPPTSPQSFHSQHRIQARPASFDSRIEYSPPPSPVVESSGSQPNEAPHPQFFNPQSFNPESLNTASPVPWSDSRSPVSSGPILTFDQAREWYDHAKNRSPVDPKVQDVVRQLGNNVRGRDHIFFVDVSESMGEHFREIAEKFKILAYLAKRFDPDGVEVCFSSEVPSIHQGTTSKLLRKFYHQEWDQFSFEDKIGTFIDRIVIPRLSSWHQRLGLTKPKNLTIFVLTDGRWGVGETGAARVEKPIMKLIDVIRGKSLSRTQVAIQFLRFGDDPDGKRYLAYLDQFGLQYNCDCIHTSPIDGNIFDMFIGAIREDIDSAGGM